MNSKCIAHCLPRDECERLEVVSGSIAQCSAFESDDVMVNIAKQSATAGVVGNNRAYLLCPANHSPWATFSAGRISDMPPTIKVACSTWLRV